MKITGMRATLAEAEEDTDSEEEKDLSDESESERGGSTSEVSAFDVPSFPYIDDEDADEERQGWWSFSSEEGCPCSSCRRYVVVSGTPLKILEHLLSDLRLDDQRGAPESRESGEFVDTHTHGSCRNCMYYRGLALYTMWINLQ